MEADDRPVIRGAVFRRQAPVRRRAQIKEGIEPLFHLDQECPQGLDRAVFSRPGYGLRPKKTA